MPTTAPRIVTCGLCGAHCLESAAQPYEYEGPAEPEFVQPSKVAAKKGAKPVNKNEGKTAVHRRLACPRCWQGISEASAI